MRYCGSVDTVPAYERVKKQPDHFNARPVKGNNHVQNKDKRMSRKNSSNPHHTITHITYKMQVNSDDDHEQAEAMEEVESLGKCLSHSPDAPKAFGIASKRRVRSSRSSCRKGFDHKEPPLSTSREPHINNTSIAHLLVRYQSIVELSSSSASASSSTSSSSASPSSTNSPHNNLVLV